MKYHFKQLSEEEFKAKKGNVFLCGLLFAIAPLTVHYLVHLVNLIVPFAEISRGIFDIVSELMWFCATVPVVVLTNNHLNFDINGFASVRRTTLILTLILALSFLISVGCFTVYQTIKNSASQAVLILTFVAGSILVTWLGNMTQRQYINDEMEQFKNGV